MITGPCKPFPNEPFRASERFRLFTHYIRTLPFIAVLAVILFSGLKPDPVPQLFDQQDKLHHMLGFAALAFTLRLAFPRWALGWLLGTSLLAALLIEVGQSLQPQRTASPADMLANTLGVLLGWGCSQILLRLGNARQSAARDAQSAMERLENPA